MDRIRLFDFINIDSDRNIGISEEIAEVDFSGHIVVECHDDDIGLSVHELIFSILCFASYVRNQNGDCIIDLFFSVAPYDNDSSYSFSRDVFLEILSNYGINNIFVIDGICHDFISVSFMPAIIEVARDVDNFDKSWLVVFPDSTSATYFGKYFDGFDAIIFNGESYESVRKTGMSIIGRKIVVVDFKSDSGNRLNKVLRNLRVNSIHYFGLMAFVSHIIHYNDVLSKFDRVYTVGNGYDDFRDNRIAIVGIEDHRELLVEKR